MGIKFLVSTTRRNLTWHARGHKFQLTSIIDQLAVVALSHLLAKSQLRLKVPLDLPILKSIVIIGDNESNASKFDFACKHLFSEAKPSTPLS